MDSREGREMSALVESFERELHKMPVPDFSSTEYLDLMDYYSRAGLAFEADLCRYFAEKIAPEDMEVRLMKAHVAADDGDWQAAYSSVNKIDIGGYDELMFKVEEDMRGCALQSAMFRIKQALPVQCDVQDYDFLLDCAELFYDYGYAYSALQLLQLIPSNYIDYEQVLQLSVECNFAIYDIEGAKIALDKMIDKHPFDDSLWTRMANLCYGEYDYQGCSDACGYALAVNTGSEAQRFVNYMSFDPSASNIYAVNGAVAAAGQDASALMHYGDVCAANMEYGKSVKLYCQAAKHCPRGHRDREKIIRSLVANSVIYRLPEYSVIFEQIVSYWILTGNLWDIVYETAQKVFEAGEKEYAVSLLNLALHHDDIKMHRLSLLVLLLHHYDCYLEARELWEYALRHPHDVGESLQGYLNDAADKIHYEW